VAKQVIAAQRARIESVIELNELSIVHVFVIFKRGLALRATLSG
jgi:hypothetical protein